ncbi:MAG: FG-GAP repeat protein [Verrucomicrobiaceae bacterium]|nr:FG-GAP repeat protein [Verrucomicrobiaceae bacterium]
MKTSFLICLISAGTLSADVLPDSYFKASNTNANDFFGCSVALSGTTMVVGAFGEQSNGTSQTNNTEDRSGAAYVFLRSGGSWTQQAYLKANVPDEDDFFGHSVAISGDTIVVGAYGRNTNTGAAYVFTRSAGVWSFQQLLTASNAAFNDRFGISVGIDGDTIIVGAEGTDQNGSSTGSAYVFTRSGVTWTQEAILTAANATNSDEFGHSVSIDGDTVIVGAVGEGSNATGVNNTGTTTNLTSAGAAYVFTRSGVTWTQQAYLKASNTGDGDFFGRSVTVFDNTVVVGATSEDSKATGINGNQADNSTTFAGAAYVFTRNGVTWSQQAYLKASNTGAMDFFGHSVALEGDRLIVSAVEEGSSATGVNGDQANNNASSAGAAYVFVRTGSTWKQEAYLKASNTDSGDAFGRSVSISGDFFAVGAINEDSSATSVNGNGNDDSVTFSGAAYTFMLEPPVPLQNYAARNARVPGGIDLFALRFGSPALDPSGQLLFDVMLTGSGAAGGKNQGMYTTLNGSPLTLALQKGASMSGVLGLPDNAKVASLLLPVPNQSSLGLFQATVTGTGITAASNRLLFKEDGVNVTPLFRTGVPITALAGAKLSTLHEVSQSSSQNAIALSYKLSTSSSTDSGLLIIDHSGAVTSSFAREGSPAFSSGGNFGQITPRVSMTAHPQPWFIGKFVIGSSAKDALFNDTSIQGSMQGDGAPVIGPTIKLGTFLAATANSSMAFFRTTLTGSPSSENEAIYDSTEALWLRKGQALAPSALKVAKILRFWPVGTAQMVLHVQITGSTSTALVLRQADGNFLFLARTGDSAPGYPTSVKLSKLNAMDVDPVNGHYVILATINGISSSANQVLYRGQTSLGTDMAPSARLPVRVLRKSQIYTSGTTPLGAIKGLSLSPVVETSGAGARGLRQIINSNGQIAVTVLGDLGSSELVVLDP